MRKGKWITKNDGKIKEFFLEKKMSERKTWLYSP